MQQIVAISNQKGGVGKTTTTVNLAACLAAAGRRCLVVDLDPQANATRALGVDKPADAGVLEILQGTHAFGALVVRTAWERLDLLWGGAGLAEIERRAVPLADRPTALATALTAGALGYDFVLLDCPPSQGWLATLALHAADSLIVPVQCETFALDALDHLLATLRPLQSERGGVPRVRGILCTMFDHELALTHDLVRELRQRHPREVFQTVIPRDIALCEAATLGQSILAYDPTSRGAVGYVRLAKEVLAS
ncbi:MAG: ParA family protein [Planctomycetes bacterium]|nr:ParA family protein [Planctomycetota bacterium]